jgi:hypothetical protein
MFNTQYSLTTELNCTWRYMCISKPCTISIYTHMYFNTIKIGITSIIMTFVIQMWKSKIWNIKIISPRGSPQPRSYVYFNIFFKMRIWIKLKKKVNFINSSQNERLSPTLIDWLIIYGFTSHLRIFHLYGDVTITGEGLQNLSLCSGPLSREGS